MEHLERRKNYCVHCPTTSSVSTVQGNERYSKERNRYVSSNMTGCRLSVRGDNSTNTDLEDQTLRPNTIQLLLVRCPTLSLRY